MALSPWGALDSFLLGHALDGAGELAAGEAELVDQGVRHGGAIMHGGAASPLRSARGSWRVAWPVRWPLVVPLAWGYGASLGAMGGVTEARERPPSRGWGSGVVQEAPRARMRARGSRCYFVNWNSAVWATPSPRSRRIVLQERA